MASSTERLVVQVAHAGGRIRRVSSQLQRSSTQLSALFSGRDPEQALQLVGMLHAICARAHAVAGARALEQARGIPAQAALERRREARVRIERIREIGLRLLRDWQYPGADEGQQQALLRLTTRLDARLSADPDGKTGHPEAVTELCRWWQAAGQSREVRQRWIHQRGEPWLGIRLGGGAPVLVPEQDERLPLVEARQTGPVASVAGQRDAGEVIRGTLRALIAQLEADLHWLQQGGQAVPRQARKTGPGQGCGWVWTARGWLLHRVALVDSRVRHWQILAPTDRNFHTEGALCQRLGGVMVGKERVEALVRELVLAHDPCVEFETRIDHA